MSVESSLHQVDGVYAFILMLISVTVIDMANRKDSLCVTDYHLMYGLARGLVVGDHHIR